jgi:hypothetical protein
MLSIQPCPLPDNALLRAYVRDGAYTDCYATDVSGAVSYEQFVIAFYSTGVFKVERFILKWAVSKPSTDALAKQLAAGTIEHFAAWRVEQRSENQLLLCDFMGRTRSWLMVAPVITESGTGTRLYFGSAVVATGKSRNDRPTMGFVFRALLGFHKLYSQVLLHAAKSRLMTQRE